jgi:hypothetical protein
VARTGSGSGEGGASGPLVEIRPRKAQSGFQLDEAIECGQRRVIAAVVGDQAQQRTHVLGGHAERESGPEVEFEGKPEGLGTDVGSQAQEHLLPVGQAGYRIGVPGGSCVHLREHRIQCCYVGVGRRGDCGHDDHS